MKNEAIKIVSRWLPKYHLFGYDLGADLSFKLEKIFPKIIKYIFCMIVSEMETLPQ